MLALVQVQCMGSPHCLCHVSAVAQRADGRPQGPFSVQPEYAKSCCFKLGLELARHWKLSEPLAPYTLSPHQAAAAAPWATPSLHSSHLVALLAAVRVPFTPLSDEGTQSTAFPGACLCSCSNLGMQPSNQIHLR